MDSIIMSWKLYEGDCLEIMPLLEDKSVDMVVTDPPYLINYFSNHRQDKSHDFCSPIENDNNPQLIKKIIPELYRVLKDNSALYLFCSPDTIDFFKKEVETYFKIKNIIIWAKNNHTAGDLEAQYGKSYEMIIYANKGRSFINGKRLTDIWEFNRISGSSQLHQNQKPVQLIERMIKKSSFENEVVLDPFSGSGTTGVASQNLNRDCIMIEQEHDYCDIIRERMKEQECLQVEQRKQKTLNEFEGQIKFKV